jgi:elongation factor Ts
MVSIDQIKKLREETGVSISECKKALIEAKGDFPKAKEILKNWGKDFAKNKTEKEAKQGIIESYIHSNKKVGVMIELCCETDFVAKNPDFQKLAHELSLQIAAINPSDENPLLNQPWIRDETKTIKDLIDEYIAKLGENIIIKRFIRYQM